MATAAKPIPDGFRTITPHLVVLGAAEAIAFYKKAFGAEEVETMAGPDGKLMHAEIKIGDSMVMLADEMPGMEYFMAPPSLKGTTIGVCLYVEDADAVFQQAVEAGAKVAMPMMDAFWGDRYGKITDPFGHVWEIVTHKEDLTPEEMAERAQAFSSGMCSE